MTVATSVARRDLLVALWRPALALTFSEHSISTPCCITIYTQRQKYACATRVVVMDNYVTEIKGRSEWQNLTQFGVKFKLTNTSFKKPTSSLQEVNSENVIKLVHIKD